LLAGITACASGGGSSASSATGTASPQGSTTRPARRNTNVLAVEEFKGLEALNLRDAIQRLRPDWLRRSEAREQGRLPGSARAEPLAVWVDESRAGGVEVLNSLTVQGVSGVRFYTGPEAEARFGNGNSSGAIHVTTAASGKKP
jgi:hypothetical protein